MRKAGPMEDTSSFSTSSTLISDYGIAACSGYAGF